MPARLVSLDDGLVDRRFGWARGSPPLGCEPLGRLPRCRRAECAFLRRDLPRRRGGSRPGTRGTPRRVPSSRGGIRRSLLRAPLVTTPSVLASALEGDMRLPTSSRCAKAGVCTSHRRWAVVRLTGPRSVSVSGSLNRRRLGWRRKGVRSSPRLRSRWLSSAARVSAALRRALVVRDGGCAYLGCDRPPNWCDAHHIVPWAKGGATRLANLMLLCRRHHRIVHEHGVRIEPTDSGPVFQRSDGSPLRRSRYAVHLATATSSASSETSHSTDNCPQPT